MTGALWTSGEVSDALRGGWTAVGVSIDSRSVRPGEIFVALKDQRDGHDFVAAALAAGAAAAIVSQRPEGVAEDAPLVMVPDTLKALEGLGAAARARTKARVVGVTGSVGKTGTKEMLRAMLSASGATHAPEKSFNNHWGVPLTLARMPADSAFAVIEMGMNHAGEIGPLSRLARPDAAIITTIAPVHMAAFDAVEQIADAKAEILEGLAPGGPAILNRDNEHFERLAAAAAAHGASVVSFGAAEAADARADSIRVTPHATVVSATLHGRKLAFKLAAPGRHLALNALSALAAVEAVGGDLTRACLALARWSPPSGRGSRLMIELGEAGIDGAIELIDESYNANPTSVRAALDVLGAAEPTDDAGRIARGRRIAFIGDMLELGAEERALHAALAEAPEMAAVDRVHTCGPLSAALHEALPADRRGQHYSDSAAMAADAARRLDAGDVAMVKGSLGSAMARVVTAIKAMGRARPAKGDADAL